MIKVNKSKKLSISWVLILVALLTSCTTMPVNDTEKVISADSIGYSSFELENKLAKANEAYDEGRLVDAEKLYLNIVFKHRNLSDAWFKLGNIYYRSGRYKAAVNAYETVLKIDNHYDKAWYNLGLSRLSQSIEVIDNGLQKMSPSSPYYLKMLSLRNNLANKTKVSTSQKEEITEIENTSQKNQHKANAIQLKP